MYRNKTDTNESDIVKALRKIPGMQVQTGHDDILVGFQGKTFWYEIKNPDRMSKKGKEYRRGSSKTQEKQDDLAENWPGHYRIVSTLDEILIDINRFKGVV